MTEEASTVPENPAPAIPVNPAVALCSAAWKRVYHSAMEKGRGNYCACLDAGLAYRKAMPLLTGSENVSSFIACVAHGILIGAIEGKDGSKLLYAAQVALATVRNQPSPPKDGAA
jgi:hypothetical protein